MVVGAGIDGTDGTTLAGVATVVGTIGDMVVLVMLMRGARHLDTVPITETEVLQITLVEEDIIIIIESQVLIVELHLEVDLV